MIRPFQRSKQKDKYSRSATYAVHGFWSGLNVTVTQRKSYGKNREWEPPQISWSCGGRDLAKEPDDIVAVKCFVKAMADAVKTARLWMKVVKP